ncbi:sulfur oxidation c-type cytochrome SoxX [Polynucleobacter paneuropaeus]|nr:sulfur oxidation c-type cytochrome SoxX [Polynucleobacter paneuropaeus]QWD36412.1 sulfur oxidation c-type cytochrome SoxX [Polynucleobacter paneuropaeus]QWD39880.1 sulfur oxidation c-type cytochrome SoxX [Polynucleobacter paneuropaeus]
MRTGRALVICLLVTLFFLSHSKLVSAVTITNGAINDPLSDQVGDPIRGRAIVLSRQTGLCILCHNGPFPEEQFQGNLAPELGASVSHYTAAQLRARLVNPAYFNPNTIMPAYYQTVGLARVAPKYAGQTILSGQEIEDVIAFLETMKSQNTK